MTNRSPAQLYALLFGVLLVAAGILGFFYDATFAVGDAASAREAVNLLAVNGWHNAVHVATGVVGLMCFGSYLGARLYALALGAVYVALGLVGLLFITSGDFLLGFIPLNTEGNVFHLLIGIAGVAAGLATDGEPAPSTTS